MTLLIVLALVVAALVGVIVGAVAIGFLPTVEEYRQLRIMAAELHADQRIDDTTRATIAAMRDAVRRHDRELR